ncbi:MAG: serine/threonine protein kinase, partial [Persicimonas sp.]
MAEESRQLGRYELVKRIATGGMGVIYLAKSRGAAGFEKTVIIKKILDHLAEEEEFVTKFCDEGRIVVNLTHGNIVPVFDMGEEDGEFFIAMEYVPGRDLRAILRRIDERDAALPIHLAVHIASEVCKGLDYAHRKTDDSGEPLNIVHRDVSPSNILISREGEVKIIDFGIARAASRAAKTVSGRIQGKVCYMSPEQAQAEDLDHRSDIFSTGVVLYEMLTGTRPFQGESDLQSLDLVRQCEFVSPRKLNPKVPAELEAIVERALERDPDDRYDSIDQMHVELLEWLYSGKSAVTGQQLADFVHELFPDGFERRELREAREASSRESTLDDRPKNLDEALEAELERLAQKDNHQPVDPLSPTAPDGGRPIEEPAPPEDQTATLDDGPEGGEVREEDGDEAATDPSGADEDGSEAPEEEAAPTRPSDRGTPSGFKRWVTIAAAVGLIVGAVGLFLVLR